MTRRRAPLLAAPAALLLGASPAFAQAAAGKGGAINVTAITLFLFFVTVTLGITYWAAGRTRSAADYYAANGQVTAFQNGLALAGDLISAGAFLGLSGLIFVTGFDGLVYAVGYTMGYPLIVFFLAEQLRRLGKYTFSDVLAFRLSQRPVRTFAAFSSLSIVAFYLIAQLVGAGQLIQLLFGLPYVYAVLIVGILMICYVMFGGMVATTWVQIIKATLLLVTATFTAILVLAAFGSATIASSPRRWRSTPGTRRSCSRKPSRRRRSRPYRWVWRCSSGRRACRTC